MISVKPDPKHPRGGYAEITVPQGAVTGETAQVAVFDNYSERFLGDAGWQPSKVLFGPYEVILEGDTARFVIGPEIVNQIEEYANVKLAVGNVEEDISWPDDVVPAPGAAKIGGILAAVSKEETLKGTLTARMPEPEPEPVEEEVPIPREPVADPVETTAETPQKRGKGAIMLVLLLCALVAAGAAYWFMMRDDVAPVPVSEVEPVVDTADPCSIAELSALDGFSAQAEALRACGANASADAALGLLERAAAGGDAAALTLFGTIYDAAVSAEIIEDQIGLTFGDVPATAAEYYARAVTAGSTQARENLQALCARMVDMTDTLVQGAVADYCGN